MIAQRLLLHRSRLNSSRVTAQHLYEALMPDVKIQHFEFSRAGWAFTTRQFDEL